MSDPGTLIGVLFGGPRDGEEIDLSRHGIMENLIVPHPVAGDWYWTGRRSLVPDDESRLVPVRLTVYRLVGLDDDARAIYSQ